MGRGPLEVGIWFRSWRVTMAAFFTRPLITKGLNIRRYMPSKCEQPGLTERQKKNCIAAESSRGGMAAQMNMGRADEVRAVSARFDAQQVQQITSDKFRAFIKTALEQVPLSSGSRIEESMSHAAELARTLSRISGDITGNTKASEQAGVRKIVSDILDASLDKHRAPGPVNFLQMIADVENGVNLCKLLSDKRIEMPKEMASEIDELIRPTKPSSAKELKSAKYQLEGARKLAQARELPDGQLLSQYEQMVKRLDSLTAEKLKSPGDHKAELDQLLAFQKLETEARAAKQANKIADAVELYEKALVKHPFVSDVAKEVLREARPRK